MKYAGMKLFSLLVIVSGLFFLKANIAHATSIYGDPQPEDNALQESSFSLGPYHINRLYPSMTGPNREQKITLGDKDGTIWVKAIHIDIVDDKGVLQPVDFLCHAWVLLNKPASELPPHPPGQKISGGGRNYYLENSSNITISQPANERKLPAGFAIPVEYKNLNASVLAMALNNHENIDKTLYYKITIQYLDETAAQKLHIKPLKVFSTYIPKIDASPLQSAQQNVPGATMCRHDQEMPMMATMRANNTAVFDVPPGRHEFHTTLDKAGIFKTGGTLHFMAMHLHTYGESMALRDKTTGQVLWQGKIKYDPANAAPLDDWYSDAKGLHINPFHTYELSGTYNNTTDKDIPDAMAMLRLYYSEE